MEQASINERIRELMIEAGYAAPELAGRALKLANLLVNESADVAGFGDKEAFVSVRIKEHFGVKE